MTTRLVLPEEPTAIGPDGSDVRVLLDTPHGGLAHFTFPPGSVSPTVRHRTVDELWYFMSGAGRMWLSTAGDSQGLVVAPGVCISIPVGTAFQVSVAPGDPLVAIGATMPPWPGLGEAEVGSDGPWTATLSSGPH